MSHYGLLPKAAALALPVTLGAWSAQAADIIQTAQRTGGFDGFLHLLEASDMAETLQGEGTFTVFAPTDEALARLPPGLLEWLVADEHETALEMIVGSHIVADVPLRVENLLDGALEVPTIGGGALAIDGTSGVIMLVPIEVTLTEVEGPTVGEVQRRAMPIAASVVMAQPDADAARVATPAVPEPIGVATVVEPDIEADNGVIHGIDLLLLPPQALWSF